MLNRLLIRIKKLIKLIIDKRVLLFCVIKCLWLICGEVFKDDVFYIFMVNLEEDMYLVIVVNWYFKNVINGFRYVCLM